MRAIVAIIISAAVGWLLWAYLLPRELVNHLAPDGTFFLLERVSKITDSGIYALPPGAEVRRVSQEGALLTVTDGHQTLEVTAAQLTNDLDIADALARSDSQNKRHFESALEQHKQQLSEKRQQEFVENARRVDVHEEARKQAAAVGRRTALDRGAYDQKQAVVGKVLYIDEGGRRYWWDTLGHRHYVP